MIKNRKLAITLIAMIIFQTIAVINTSFAASTSTGDVVINEVAWMGSEDSTSDEWIELYNNSNQVIDLSDWYIKDDDSSTYTITAGSIQPHGYFLIEDSEVAVNSTTADAVIGVSLANAGDSLKLYNNTNVLIDTVNSTGGAWFAGNSTDKATMERINPNESGDDEANWANASNGNGETGRNETAILGTPGSVNSVYTGNGSAIIFDTTNNTIEPGQNFTVSIDVESVIDLYAYGIDIEYDASKINFVSASESNFLNSDGSSTSFNAAKENGVEGKLIIGNSRILNPPSGIDGSGELLTIEFTALAGASGVVEIVALPSSFLADSISDFPVSFNDISISISEPVTEAIINESTEEGTTEYSINLSYEYSGVIDTFIIEKQMPNGTFETVGSTTELRFTDNQNVNTGINYTYRVTHMLNGQATASVTFEGADSRGIIGDVNHSTRVDGRDIEALARSYGSEFGDEEYNVLADTNYDGIIDGNDLINIGANFGVTTN